MKWSILFKEERVFLSKYIIYIIIISSISCKYLSTSGKKTIKSCGIDIVLPNPKDPQKGMVEIPGGTNTIGVHPLYPEEGPARTVHVPKFWMDKTDVTNSQFAEFVRSTGYLSSAEQRTPPSSIVFFQRPQGVDLGNPSQWWEIVEGAGWSTPGGRGTDIQGKEEYPVVHISQKDALAYAEWLGHDLPTEIEWEYAARGGRVGNNYVWGNTEPESGKPKANIWEGLFPIYDRGEDGFQAETSPVGCYSPNEFGLYDMAGNVWQWTKDDFSTHGKTETDKAVIKGGSFLCASSYCKRFRPSARTSAEKSEGTSHIGFRTVYRPKAGFP